MPPSPKRKVQKVQKGWKRSLAFPIRLRNGATIATLEQAAGLMTQRLPKRRQLVPVWQRSAALLMEAHASGKRDDLEHATRQLRRALDIEGWA